MPAGLEDIRSIIRADRKRGQKALIISVILFIAFCMMTLCFDYDKYVDYNVVQWISPWQALKGIWYGFRLQMAELFYGTSDSRWFNLYHFVFTLPDQDAPVGRLWQLCLTAISGAVISLSGTVYQSAMRNAMAVPTMLGVTSGVNLAKMIILFYVGLQPFRESDWRAILFCYAVSGVVLGIILLVGKICGGKHVSVVDMLLAGTIINRLFQSLANYYQDQMSEDLLYDYEQLSQKTYSLLNQAQNLLIMVILTTIIMIPILLMRFSYNAISFEDVDARCFGVNPNAMRVYAMVAGAVLTAAVMIHYGDVATLALIVPHICRYTFGSDFRRVVTTSAFYGAFILVIAWFTSNFTWIGYYQIPVGTIISVIVMPVLIWFSFKQRHGWD